MPTPYPTISGNQSSSLYTIFQVVNNGVAGTFMPIMLLVIWVISFVGVISEGRQASRAWIFSSFICSILAIVLSLIGMLNTQYMYFLFLMVAAGLVWYKLDNAPGI